MHVRTCKLALTEHMMKGLLHTGFPFCLKEGQTNRRETVLIFFVEFLSVKSSFL